MFTRACFLYYQTRLVVGGSTYWHSGAEVRSMFYWPGKWCQLMFHWSRSQNSSCMSQQCQPSNYNNSKILYMIAMALLVHTMIAISPSYSKEQKKSKYRLFRLHKKMWKVKKEATRIFFCRLPRELYNLGVIS